MYQLLIYLTTCTGTWQCIINPETDTPEWHEIECHTDSQEPVAVQEEVFSSPVDVLVAAQELYEDGQLEIEGAIEVVASVVDRVPNGDTPTVDKTVRGSVQINCYCCINLISSLLLFIVGIC